MESTWKKRRIIHIGESVSECTAKRVSEYQESLNAYLELEKNDRKQAYAIFSAEGSGFQSRYNSLSEQFGGFVVLEGGSWLNPSSTDTGAQNSKYPFLAVISFLFSRSSRFAQMNPRSSPWQSIFPSSGILTIRSVIQLFTPRRSIVFPRSWKYSFITNRPTWETPENVGNCGSPRE